MIEVKPNSDDQKPEIDSAGSDYVSVRRLVSENAKKWTIKQKIAIIRALFEDESGGLGSV